MIVANLIGGLGNQMFQYAMARALSVRLSSEMKIVTDMFDGYPLHNGYELERVFGIKIDRATPVELKSLIGWRASSNVRHFLARPRFGALWNRHALIERFFHHDPSVFDRRALPVYVHGYWQSEKYFSDCRDVILSDFHFVTPWSQEDIDVLKMMREAPSASVHVRRGDYLSKKNSGYFSSIELDYYTKAMGAIKQRLPAVRFFVFSDDPEWAARHIASCGADVVHVVHNRGSQAGNDMRLMSSADHQVIANSTFSWWGAWLNPNPEKMVFVPSRWFGIRGPSDHDLIPNGWNKISS